MRSCTDKLHKRDSLVKEGPVELHLLRVKLADRCMGCPEFGRFGCKWCDCEVDILPDDGFRSDCEGLCGDSPNEVPVLFVLVVA